MSTVQQQQILTLHCLISAYSMSVLSLEGSRSSEAQLIASGILLSTASIAFSFARPLDRLSSVLPLASIFHPALFLSVLGQLAIHASCMIYATKLAKAHMGDEAIAAAVAFARKADKLAEAGDEEAASSHKPNLLNTMVFLVETAQQVAVMLVNYKGRPWMKGVTENPGLLYSLAGCVAGDGGGERCRNSTSTWASCRSPTMRRGTLARVDRRHARRLARGDRLCVLIFAPRIFKSQVDEIAALSIGDFGAQPAKYCATASPAPRAYYTVGNRLILGMVYRLYRRTQSPQPWAPGAAPPAQ